MVRGNCGFGNEPFIAELEARNQPYLFKLRQTKGIHKLLQRQFQREDWLAGGNKSTQSKDIKTALEIARQI